MATPQPRLGGLQQGLGAGALQKGLGGEARGLEHPIHTAAHPAALLPGGAGGRRPAPPRCPGHRESPGPPAPPCPPETGGGPAGAGKRSGCPPVPGPAGSPKGLPQSPGVGHQGGEPAPGGSAAGTGPAGRGVWPPPRSRWPPPAAGQGPGAAVPLPAESPGGCSGPADTGLPGGGEVHPAVHPLEELCPIVLLQLPDGQAHRGLGGAQGVGGFAEALQAQAWVKMVKCLRVMALTYTKKSMDSILS